VLALLQHMLCKLTEAGFMSCAAYMACMNRGRAVRPAWQVLAPRYLRAIWQGPMRAVVLCSHCV